MGTILSIKDPGARTPHDSIKFMKKLVPVKIPKC